MTQAEREKAYGKAGAEAIELGADPAQVVNARRGMAPAQMYGREVLITTEGTTRRGVGYQAMRDHGQAGVGKDTRAKGGPYFRAKSARLMPETIMQIADGPQDAMRLLRLYGYIR